jgi:hypothetical protein
MLEEVLRACQSLAIIAALSGGLQHQPWYEPAICEL